MPVKIGFLQSSFYEVMWSSLAFDRTAWKKTGPKNRTKVWSLGGKPLSFMELNIFGRHINYRVFFKMHIQIFKYFPLLRKHCQLNRPMMAREKTGRHFRANDHALNFCKYCQNNQWLEMCQYDTDALAQGHPHPHAGILQKMKLKKGP